MPDSELLFIGVASDDTAGLIEAIQHALPDGRVEVASVPDERPDEGVRLGREQRLFSVAADVAIVLVSGAGLARALAPVLVERTRARRRGVRILSENGTTVEIHGGFDKDEVKAIVDEAVTHRLPPSEQT